MIEVTCPKCGELLSVPSCLMGEAETCPGCGGNVRVPEEDSFDRKLVEKVLGGDHRAIRELAAREWRDLPGLLCKIYGIQRESGPQPDEYDDAYLTELSRKTRELANIVEVLDPSAVPALASALKHRDSRVREQACWALRVIGLKMTLPAKVVSCLGRLAADRVQSVRGEALCTLETLGNENKADLLPAVPGVLVSLKSSVAEERKMGARIIGKVGRSTPEMVGELQRLLMDADIDVAQQAKQTLNELGENVQEPSPGSPEDAERLALRTVSSDLRVQEEAWAALREHPNRQGVVPVLMRLYRDGKLRSPRLCEYLGVLTPDIAQTPLLAILREALESPDPSKNELLRDSACFGLLRIGIPPVAPGVPPDLRRRILVRGLMYAATDDEALGAIADALSPEDRAEAIEGLASSFRDRKDEAWQVCTALGRLRGPEAVGLLLDIFRALGPCEAEWSGNILLEYGGKAGAPASALVKCAGNPRKLRGLCSEPEYQSILLATDSYAALGEIGSREAIGRLLFALSQDHWGDDLRRSAIHALGTTGASALSILVDELRTVFPGEVKRQVKYRTSILEALTLSGDRRCEKALLSVAKGGGIVGKKAEEALAAIARRDPRVKAFEATLRGATQGDAGESPERSHLRDLIEEFKGSSDFGYLFDLAGEIADAVNKSSMDLLVQAMENAWKRRMEFGPGARERLGAAYERLVGKHFPRESWLNAYGSKETDGGLRAALAHWKSMGGKANGSS